MLSHSSLISSGNYFATDIYHFGIDINSMEQLQLSLGEFFLHRLDNQDMNGLLDIYSQFWPGQVCF